MCRPSVVDHCLKFDAGSEAAASGDEEAHDRLEDEAEQVCVLRSHSLYKFMSNHCMKAFADLVRYSMQCCTYKGMVRRFSCCNADREETSSLHYMQGVDKVFPCRTRVSLMLRAMKAEMRAMGMEMKGCHGRLSCKGLRRVAHKKRSEACVYGCPLHTLVAISSLAVPTIGIIVSGVCRQLGGYAMASPLGAKLHAGCFAELIVGCML